MATPTSREELIEYAKRQLGAPVLEINVADEQCDDIVDDALQFFYERHFDGVMQCYLLDLCPWGRQMFKPMQ